MRLPVWIVLVALTVTGCAMDVSATVPREHRKPIREAARYCPDLTPRLLAAQLDQESSFNPEAVSPAGAEGIAQFVPDTWARWGQDLDGDGESSPFNPREAIDAQGRLMCFLIEQAKYSGIEGDPYELALAGYNAGWSNVEQYQGIPPFRETEDYINRITDRAPNYRFRD